MYKRQVYNLPGGSKVLVSDEQKVKAGDRLAETIMISEHGGEVRYSEDLVVEAVKSGKNKINKIVQGKEITIVIASLMPANATFEQTKKEQLWTVKKTGEKYIVKAPIDTTVENGMIIAELIDDECSVSSSGEIKYVDIEVDDNQIVTVTPNSMKLIDIDNNSIQGKVETLPWEPVALSKMGYKHFMLKEIHEQPDVVRNVLSGKLRAMDEPIHLKEVTLDRDKLKNLNRIQIVACGTSLHAAMVGKYIIEDFCGISVDVEPSSEYIYRKTITDQNTLVIGVSQSGETADTITAVRQAKAKGSHILIVTNRPDSTMAREADSLVPVYAGIEVSVAATKSYMAQLISFYLLAIYMAEVKGVNEEELRDLKHELIVLPQKIEKILSHKEDIQKCARAFSSSKDFIFIARGINYPTALEGALKLKEISYINATGYTAGELKHGPIAMLDETMPVLSILMKGKVYDKILSNSEEARARNARMIALTDSDDTKLNELFDYIIRIPEISEILSPALAVVPLQLLAYYLSLIHI